MKASWPVTFCSMIEGTSASITRPVRPIRQSWLARQTSDRIWWGGSNPLGSSSAPSSAGTDSRAQRAPSPQDAAYTAPSRGRLSIISVATPSGVRMPRQWRPWKSVL